jgi:hypothetical protein
MEDIFGSEFYKENYADDFSSRSICCLFMLDPSKGLQIKKVLFVGSSYYVMYEKFHFSLFYSDLLINQNIVRERLHRRHLISSLQTLPFNLYCGVYLKYL